MEFISLKSTKKTPGIPEEKTSNYPIIDCKQKQSSLYQKSTANKTNPQQRQQD